MDPDAILISLLSFGDTGMEFVGGQFGESIDEDHTTLIGNFYSNVLGAAEESNGLFGPLPVAYRYDTLLFLYAFNAYDPNLKDERVIKRNHMTRAELLIFFPAALDSIFSNQRKQLKAIIENWTKDNETNDIRKIKKHEINKLREKIYNNINHVINQAKLNPKSKDHLVKVIGKNITLLNTISSIQKTKRRLKFYSNFYDLKPVLNTIILSENIEDLYEFKKNAHTTYYKLNNVEIYSYHGQPMHFLETFSFRDDIDGLFFFFSNSNGTDLIEFEKILEKFIPQLKKETFLSICFDLKEDIQEFLGNNSISDLLARERDRSINLVNLKENQMSLEASLIGFFEMLVSQHN